MGYFSSEIVARTRFEEEKWMGKALKLGETIGTGATSLRRFKSEVINGLGTDQRGGETSSASPVDEHGNLPSRCCFHAVASWTQASRRSKFWPDNCSDGPRINTHECYTTFASARAGQMCASIFRLINVSADYSGQSEYGDA